jgi:hypothetical protein
MEFTGASTESLAATEPHLPGDAARSARCTGPWDFVLHCADINLFFTFPINTPSLHAACVSLPIPGGGSVWW